MFAHRNPNLRPFAGPAGGIQTNSIASTPALAGLAPAATQWTPRYLQFPNRYMIDGLQGCPSCLGQQGPGGSIWALALGGLGLYMVMQLFMKNGATKRKQS